MTSYRVNLTSILTVQQGHWTPEVFYEDCGSLYCNHHATLHRLYNTVAITAILGKISKLQTLSTNAVRDQITCALPRRKLSCDSANFVLYYKMVLVCSTKKNCLSIRVLHWQLELKYVIFNQYRTHSPTFQKPLKCQSHK